MNQDELKSTDADHHKLVEGSKNIANSYLKSEYVILTLRM